MEPTDIEVAVVTRDRARLLAAYALPGLVEIASAGVPVLVVDQSGDAGTAAIVAGTGVRCIRTLSRGLSAGRNVALVESRSVWVAFTDDDMRPTPAWLAATAAAVAARPDVSAVLGRGVWPDGRLMSGGPPGRHRWPTDVFVLGSGYSFAVARRAALGVGGFHGRFGAGGWFGAAEDTLMLYRLLRTGHGVLCEDAVRIEHPEWRSGRAQAWRQFRYGRGTAAVALAGLTEGDRETAGRAWARMIRQGRRVSDLLRSARWAEAAAQACYLAGALSAVDAPLVLRLDRPESAAAAGEQGRIAGHRAR